jgi:hypothetical protein
MSFAMLEGKCYCCGKSGHKSTTCRLKDSITKENWAIKKAKTKEQSHVNANPPKQQRSPAPTQEKTETTPRGWSGAHVQVYQAKEMKNWIILDNGSTVSLFCNPDLVENVIETSETLEL